MLKQPIIRKQNQKQSIHIRLEKESPLKCYFDFAFIGKHSFALPHSSV